MPIRLLQDMECSGKTVVIRQDLNVPMKDGRITNDKRIRAALPGIRMALDKGAGVVLLSHLGRPTEGVVEEKFSLAPVAAHLSGLLGRPVKLAADFDAAKAAPGEVVLLENIRFFKGEKKNDPELAAKLAALGDIYVMDAFGAAHRAHSSTEGAVRAAKVACAGPLMAAELDAFAKVLDAPARPLMAIIGGSKVSTKLGLLDNLLGKVDTLIVGGGIANTFLAAAGYSVGTSLYEPELVDDAKKVMAKAKELGKTLLKAFIFSLTQQDKLPKTILLYNGGAHLTCEGSPMLDDLKALEAEGVEILTCGTCLNFYGLTEKLAVGGVTNMYVIAEKMLNAGNVVKP